MHTILAKAVAFGEALRPSFVTYSQNVIDNAKILAQTLLEDGFDIISGGTDSHLVLVDLRPKNIKGNEAEDILGKANITCNKNGVPFDPEKPTITSGIRLEPQPELQEVLVKLNSKRLETIFVKS